MTKKNFAEVKASVESMVRIAKGESTPEAEGATVSYGSNEQGYFLSVQWSAEDSVFVGRCRDFSIASGLCHGDTPEETMETLRGIIAGEIMRYRAEGLLLPPVPDAKRKPRK